MIVFVLLFYQLAISFVKAQVSITPECSIDDTQLNCHCNPDDPVREYGDNFLVEIQNQFKDDYRLNKAQKLVLTNCNVPFKFNLDLNKLEKVSTEDGLARFESIQDIIIENTSPVSIYLSGRLLNGDLNVTFHNIHEHNELGSVVLTGGMDYCTKSCETTIPDQTGPPSKWTTCNDCVPSDIRFSFINVDHVYLGHFGIGSYEHNQDEGHAILYAQRVKTFRVNDPFLSRVEVDSIKADECWLREKYLRNPYTDEQVNCNSFDHWNESLGAGYIVLIVLLCLGAVSCLGCVCFGYKKKQDASL